MNGEEGTPPSDSTELPELTDNQLIEILSRLVAVALSKLLLPEPEDPKPRQASDPIELLTPEEVSDKFQIQKDHLYELVRQGSIPAVDIGRKRRFRTVTLEKWLRKQEEEAVSEGKSAEETSKESTRTRNKSDRYKTH